MQESAEEDALEQAKLQARIEELSMQLEAVEEAHKVELDENWARLVWRRTRRLKPFMSIWELDCSLIHIRE